MSASRTALRHWMAGSAQVNEMHDSTRVNLMSGSSKAPNKPLKDNRICVKAAPVITRDSKGRFCKK